MNSATTTGFATQVEATPVALVDVLGDLAWLKIYKRDERPRDTGPGRLSPYRRVRRSHSLSLPAGTWLLAQYLRAALNDVFRIPLYLPLDLRSHSLRIASTPETASALRITLTTFDDSMSAVIPARELLITAKPDGTFNLIAELDDAAVEQLDKLGTVPEFACVALSTATWLMDDFATRAFTVATATPKDRHVVKGANESVIPTAVFQTPVWQLLPATMLTGPYIETLRDPGRLKEVLALQDQLAGLGDEADVKAFFKLLAIDGQPIEVHFLDDVVISLSRWFSDFDTAKEFDKYFHTIEFRHPAREPVSIEFDEFLDSYPTRLKLGFPADALIGSDIDKRAALTGLQWKAIAGFFQKSPNRNSAVAGARIPQAHVRTYSLDSTVLGPNLPTLDAWWEAKPTSTFGRVTRRRMSSNGTDERVRLDKVMGDTSDAMGSNFQHESFPLQSLPSTIADDEATEDVRHLVFCDLDTGFRLGGRRADVGRKEKKAWTSESEYNEADTEPDWKRALGRWNGLGVIAIDLGRSLPLNRNGTEWSADDLWSFLRKKNFKKRGGKDRIPFRKRTIVIASAHLLRAHGARISHRLSWERAAETCWDALKSRELLKPLLEFAFVVVRFGCAGAMVVRHGEPNTEMRLFVDVCAKGGFFRDPDRDGRVLGSNSVMLASILRQIVVAEPKSSHKQVRGDVLAEAVYRGVRVGIPLVQDLYLAGYERFMPVEAIGTPWPDIPLMDYHAPLTVFKGA